MGQNLTDIQQRLFCGLDGINGQFNIFFIKNVSEFNGDEGYIYNIVRYAEADLGWNSILYPDLVD